MNMELDAISRLREVRGSLLAAAKALDALQSMQALNVRQMAVDARTAAGVIGTSWIPALQNDEVVF